MSKQWTIAIGVGVGILALCLASVAGLAIGRASTFAGMQNPRGFNQPGQVEGRGRFNQNPQAENSQLEVTLIDDDEDGIPDRGVVEMPAGPGFNRGFDGKFNDRGGPPQNFGRGFDPARGRFNRVPFLPFGFFGGLLCLTTLGGLVVLAVALYRRQSSPSPASPDATASSVETDEADAPEDIEPEPEVSDEVAAGEDDNAEPDPSVG